MIYISADDYGLCDEASVHIKQCADEGALNKISVFPNLDTVDLTEMLKDNNTRVALHINLVEGRCMADASKLDLLTDKSGNFIHTFTGLLKQSLVHGKRFESQVYTELKAQILHWQSILPKDAPIYIDSHQHTHMIPAVFRALMKVLHDENIKSDYVRIPAEPLLPYIMTPSLYFTYSAVNVIKQWLLKFLWLINKPHAKKHCINKAYFMGVLFSGMMDFARVNKILPKYIRRAQNSGRDIEVLFHPGYISESDFNNKNVVFNKFYFSQNRKVEFDAVIKISRKEVQNNALY